MGSHIRQVKASEVIRVGAVSGQSKDVTQKVEDDTDVFLVKMSLIKMVDLN